MTVHYSKSFSDAPMTSLSWDKAVESIRIGADGLAEEVTRLRKVAALDASVYAQMKRQLPWLCCGEFREGIRQLTHFESIKYFILDFDQIQELEDTPAIVKLRMAKDLRVFAAFLSPSGKGLKVIFKLERPILDIKQYSDLYKQFAASFSKAYGLTAYCDFTTSDATRVCFLSYDPDIIYRPEAQPLEVVSSLAETLFGNWEELEPELEHSTPRAGHPGLEALESIRQKFLQNPPKQKPVKHFFVPDAVLLHIPFLKITLGTYNLQLLEQSDVQYGVKIKVASQNPNLYASCNIYYGKKGFSVVLVPTRDSNTALAQIVEKVVWHSIQERNYPDAKVISIQNYGGY